MGETSYLAARAEQHSANNDVFGEFIRRYGPAARMSALPTPHPTDAGAAL